MLTTGDPGSGESCVCRVCRGRGGGGESAPELEGVRVPTSKNLCLKNWPVLSSIALYQELFDSCVSTKLCAPGQALEGVDIGVIVLQSWD